jgi:hypothetical protein
MLSEWLLFLHIVSGVVYLGGAVAVTVQATGAAAMPRQFLKLADVAGRAIGIGAVLTLVTGIALVLENDFYGFSMTFVLIGIGGLLISGAVDGMFTRRKVAALQAALDEEGSDAPGIGEGLRRVTMVNAAVIGILVFVIWAMVFKPGV